MLNKNIIFKDQYANEECGTTTLYFSAPKEMLKQFTNEEYPEAVSMTISIEFPTDHPKSNLAGVSFSPTKIVDDISGTGDYDWNDIVLPYDEIEELISMADEVLKSKEIQSFRMCAGIQFNRPIDDEIDYICPGGYTFVMNGKTVQFDFYDYSGGINKDNPCVLDIEVRNPMYEEYSDLRVLTAEMFEKITEINEFFVFTGEAGESDLKPVSLRYVSFIFPYMENEWKECKVVEDVLKKAVLTH